MQYRCRFALLTIATLIFLTANAQAEGPPTGEQIYRRLCAECHGADGQGTEDYYPQALIGDKPVDELAAYIHKTMPEGEPEKCVGEDAQAVARYVYDAFYSPTAQARNRPARVALSRLTVRQYEHAVADLIAAFTPEPSQRRGRRGGGDRQPEQAEQNETARGLRGEYFNAGRRIREDKRVLDRIDPRLDFQFGEGSPEEKISKEEFAARWTGSVLVPETGDYEFILKTENGGRLWVNDDRTALIDAWVKSGDQTEYRAVIRLLGGRSYPLRVEFFKSKEAKQKTASVALWWKPPHAAEQVIPQRHLSPARTRETFVVTTPFPPDDRSTGYERGTSVSKAWDSATTYAAIEIAGHVANNLSRLAGVNRDTPDRAQRLNDFCVRFAERAFRRPLTDEQRQLYIERQFAEAADADAAVKRALLLVLKSPRFLYRQVGSDGFDAYDTAAWLSFGLWDSLPDQELIDAAASEELVTRDQIAAQAERMLADARTGAKVREFLHQWIGMDRFHEITKDAEAFPGFDEQIVSDLRTSLELSLDDAVWGESPDFRQLLLADELYLNGRLAEFYKADLPADADPQKFQKVRFEPEKRAGIVSHPYLMAAFAYYETSSPIHRGVFLSRSVLGRFIKPPPEAFTPLAPDLHPDLTTRERTHLQTKAETCQACHSMINPLGFTLEHFDAVGRYRAEEKSKPIDASGSYRTPGGQTTTFTGARELAAFLAESPDVHSAFVEQLFGYMTKHPVQAFDRELYTDLNHAFTDQKFSIRMLLVNTVTESALAMRGLRNPQTAAK